MLTVTPDAFHENLKPGKDEIILNGPPGNLSGYMVISNKTKEPLSIKALGVMEAHKKGKSLVEPMHLRMRLRAGEERMEAVSYQLPLTTPPGTYERKLVIGGKEQLLKLVVQSVIKINVNPVHFTFLDSSPKKTQQAVFTVTNMGNMPFQVPEVKHITTLDMDYLCRATSIAIRDKGQEGYMAMMDEITRNINKEMTAWVSVKIKESGKIIEPGKTMALTLVLVQPNDMDPKKDYSGNIRFWNKELTYEIKSHT